MTLTFELTGPENRVVTPYDKSNITLLGARWNEEPMLEMSPDDLDDLALELGVNRPSIFKVDSVEELMELVNGFPSMGEGVVLVANLMGLFWRVKVKNPWILTGLLYAPQMSVVDRRPWLRHLVQPDALHPHYSLVDEQHVHWANTRGYRVHTWTVDEPGDMWQLRKRGVDLIITNRPDILAQVLGTGPGQEHPATGRLPSALRL